MIETKKVTGRRKLRFANYDEVLAEARVLASKPTRNLGNWSLGQICLHLAITIDESLGDAKPFAVSWKFRIVGRLIRRRVLRDGISPGFKLPKDGAEILVPPPTSSETGLAELEHAIFKLQQRSRRFPHPVLGNMSVPQWDQFHFRHAEMHLSFIVPD